MTWLNTRLRQHWLVGVVLAAYVAAAFIVPTMAPVPESDDWIFARSVEILVQEHQLRILPTTVPTTVFQVVWGALFAAWLGMTFGALRVSTVVMMLLSAGAFYALCRELGANRERSALGTAVYLFNPLAFVLGFTFMTDPHLTALLVISTYLYVRGLRAEPHAERWTWLGSGVAALAFLVRQQGILVPVGVLSYLVLSRRLRWNRAGALQTVRVAGLPVTIMAVYYVWLRFVNGVPRKQLLFLGNVASAMGPTTLVLTALLVLIAAMYAGFFVLPIALAALPAIPHLMRATPRLGRASSLVWLGLFTIGLSICTAGGMRMPYVPHFFTTAGLGANDLLVSRAPLLGASARSILTAVCGLCAAALSIALCSQLGAGARRRSDAATLVAAIALCQMLGVLMPSFSFRSGISAGLPAPSLDRYLLPLLPFMICLLLSALSDVQLSLPVGWTIVAALAAFSVAATRDSLVFNVATWDLARQANALGIANERLDAGATWDGYHLYEYSMRNRIPIQTPAYPYSTGASDVLHVDTPPWWIHAWAQATDSSYVVTGEALPGFAVVTELEYSRWLQRKPGRLYLLRRPGVVGPP